MFDRFFKSNIPIKAQTVTMNASGMNRNIIVNPHTTDALIFQVKKMRGGYEKAQSLLNLFYSSLSLIKQFECTHFAGYQ